MSKYKSSKKWVKEHIADPYVKLAQKFDYRARSAFKLIEIIETLKINFASNKIVVDLGSSPGSWSQVMRNKMILPNGNINGRIIALDILSMEPISGVDFIQGDFRDVEIQEILKNTLYNQLVDIVISDMAPNLTGIASADSARVQDVCELAMSFSVDNLKSNGVMIVKAFHGAGFSQIVHLYKKFFKKVVEFKPKASRDRSSETFLIAQNLK
ncbi:RlmE family RNA methyltransferase [Candidatus Kinetoplastidibacterium crithidiae]|uniref:Ribosomal RNA large subunit methyltransferase E n=1 Tax=Candidatus Kinetoplastidibacterium crithidiae TCC036E TaxID=1208918 RepID=M1M5J7_9PROT|nr:RlmE family RNA methyltransferase [Candidatus Kinetoplastibacterium crithidii]AFZ83164.1 23S rRNA (uridine2552-2'-O)-methyltransferase [Candidatus Kinetoplastibacterium crithidii (ex Angomonas deanei ATCC 30255)]AGF47440.1 ribosomal RNA large subunit methyltransferase E [Candidatus Kinetoplastibacterium crithidii TCC036E]